MKTWRFRPLLLLVAAQTVSGQTGFPNLGREIKKLVWEKFYDSVRGERTAGAVLGGQPFLLSDGSLLFLAVQDVRVDGERLEGVGVKPDVAVAADLPYSEGRDAQLERALDVAAERVTGQ